MALTYGFYNSVNGDRKYDADQMSAVFDGVINDGVFPTVGEKFAVKVSTGLTVTVAPGRAWFNRTWTYLDVAMPLSVGVAHPTLPRIDAVVLEVDKRDDVRANSIKIIAGTADSAPQKPSLSSSGDVYQHALAYITVPAGATALAQGNIEYVVGLSGCPYVTSVIETTDVDALFAQWDDQFNTWFDNVQSQLEGNVVTNLQNQIDDIKEDNWSEAVSTLLGLGAAATPKDGFEALFNFKKGSYNAVLIRRSGAYKVPTNILAYENNAVVISVGGGGGGGLSGSGGGGGGGAGYVEIGVVTLTSGQTVQVVVGAGGLGSTSYNQHGGNGGETTFLNITGAGGGGGQSSGVSGTNMNGGNGSAGGGGGFLNSYQNYRSGSGGIGLLFGGGGGAVGLTDSDTRRGTNGGNGGNGGRFGGGGGAGSGGEPYIANDYTAGYPGNPGAGGDGGGDGGAGGRPDSSFGTAGDNGSYCNLSIDLLLQLLLFTTEKLVPIEELDALGGNCGQTSNLSRASGGGGGGGFGGRGGSSYSSGGGGGGFLCPGGNGSSYGGGGGGFLCPGKDGSGNGGGGGGGFLGFGSGGSGGNRSDNVGTGTDGCVILMYLVDQRKILGGA